MMIVIPEAKAEKFVVDATVFYQPESTVRHVV